MAITVAEIVAKIRADGADQVVSEFKRADDATSSLTSRIGALGPKMVSAGQKATLGMTLPIAGMAVGFVMAASDLNEATTAATTTYGAAAEQIVAWSQNSAQAVGLSSQQYLAAATQLGVFGNAAGLTGSDLASFGNDTIKAAADLASFYNVPVPEALDAIRAGLTGETEGLRRFGIMMNDATIQAYAMENGIWDGTGAMTEQQKILARQGFIMESMGAATGDFANTSDGLANQMRILKAELTNVAASMGQHLLPIVIKGVSFVRKLVDIFGGLSPSVQKVILIFMALAAAIGPVLVVAGTLIGAVTSIAAAFGAGGLLAPLLAVLGPIALVVGALALLAVAYKTNFLGFGDAVRAVAGWVADGFGRIMGFVGTLIDVFKGFAGPSDKVSDGFRKIGLALTLAKFDSLPGPIRMVARGLVYAAAALSVSSYRGC
jgi:hypothetical protein